VRAQDVLEPRLYCFIGETDARYHEVDARLHRQVLALDHQAQEVLQLCQEVAQGCCWCQGEEADSPISQPRSVYGDEDGREIYGSECSLDAVGSGSNATGDTPVVDEGIVVPLEVRVEEVAKGLSASVAPEINGQEAMLALVEQEMLKTAWGIHRHSPTLEEELTDLSVGEHITEAWFEE